MNEEGRPGSHRASVAPSSEGRGAREIPRAALDGLHDYVVRLDADDRLVYVNRAPPGYKVEQLVGRSIYDFIEPNDRVFRKLRFDEVRRTGIASTIEVTRPNLRGEIVHFEARCVPFPGDASHDLLVVYTDVSARVRAERAREASETRLRAIVEKSSEVGLLFLEDGTRTYASPAIATVLGYTPDEWAVCGGLALVHPDDGEAVRVAAASVVASRGATATCTCRLKHRDGRWRTFEGTATNKLDDQTLRAVVVVARDVTDRNLAESRRAETEARFERAQEDGGVGSWVYTYATEALEWSKETYQIFCIPPRDAVRIEELFAKVHPDDVERVKRAMVLASVDGAPYDVEHRIVRADGTVRWVHERAACIKDASGKTLQMVGTAQDVTNLRLAEEERDRFFMLSHELSCVVGVDGLFQRVSPAWRALGWERSDLLGRSWIDFVHPDDRASTLRAPNHAPRAGQDTFTFETRFLCKRGDGQRGEEKDETKDEEKRESEAPPKSTNAKRPCDEETYRLLAWTALPHPHQPILYATARDMTDTRRIESQLRIAERMASLGTLAAGVAHEINNPLAYIQTNLEFANEELAHISGSAIDEIRHALDDAEHGVKRVRSIVSDLRMFARVDEEQQENVDIPSAIDAAVNLVSSQIRQRARLVTRFGQVPRIHADPTRLSQVFVNLLVNAVQALGPNVERNEITIVANANADGAASIEFRDNGCGISRDHLARIFDPFFTTKPVGIGTGLGLAISHNLVTTMGGRFEVESEVGLGTTFRLIFPACHAHAVSTPSVAPAEHAARAARSRSVLVVDDEALIGVSIRRLLPEHTVTLATSPQAALDLIEQGDLFDVILCDVIMPTMGAQQFIPALTKASPTLAARVILTSGGLLSAEVRAFVEKAPRFLPKPFDGDQLRRLIDEVCNAPSTDEVEPIKTDGALARMVRKGDTLHVTMSGIFDTQRLADALHVFASALHACAQRTKVSEVKIDFRNVSFLTSSCFKAFVTWVGRLEDAPIDEKYRIVVVTDASRSWQARSFAALTCFAPDHLRLDAL